MNRAFLGLCRTLHIYLTMFGLLVMSLFGITGFTINHEDWFGATTPRTSRVLGSTPLCLVNSGDSLHIVEQLRQNFHITGALTGFSDLGDRIAAGFKEPGQSWEIEIDKGSGKTTVRNETFNLAAVLNNLHRGRYTGAPWSIVIDVCAALITLACVTGLILWLALPKRRIAGIAMLLIGAATLAVFVFYLVPGADLPLAQKRVPPAAEPSASP